MVSCDREFHEELLIGNLILLNILHVLSSIVGEQVKKAGTRVTRLSIHDGSG